MSSSSSAPYTLRSLWSYRPMPSTLLAMVDDVGLPGNDTRLRDALEGVLHG